MWKYIKPFLPYVILAGLFMFIEVSVDLIQPSIMLKIVDEGILGLNNGNLELIFRYGLQMIIIVIIGGLSGSLNNIFVHLSGQNIGNEIRKDSFRKIMSFSFSDVDLYSSGALVTRVTNDITQVQNFVSQFVRGMIRTMMQMFGSLFLMYQLNIHFGIIVTLAFPVIAGSLLYCMYKADPLFDRLQSSLDEINNILEEDLNGIRIIKACVKEVYEKIRFKKANNELIKTQLKVLIIFAFMNPVVNCLMYLVVALILWFGYQDVLSGFTTPGTIMAAITYTTQMLNGILMLNLLIQNISRGITSWKRIRKILNYEPSLKSGNYKDEPEVHGLIEIKNLSFSYNHSQKILYDINLKIYPGETLAIMGATGSGKTTLLNLICRFYDANEGEILIDGINIKDYDLSNLRKRISLVLQKSELF
ncbi:MAG: ABC transporter ATP-binding protein, partial [Erysipelotrichaceae bacterium]